MTKQFGWTSVALILLANSALAERSAKLPLKVLSDFPSGNAEVLSIDQAARHIQIRPRVHEGRGWACWWYFQVTGIEPGETIAIEVGDAPWATPNRAAFSVDDRQWRQTASGQRDGKRIVYRQAIDSNTAWFAWGPPFTMADAKQLVEAAAEDAPFAEAFTLCETRGGRPVPALRIHQSGVPDSQRRGIWIQARQHAWESGASWVCRGVIDWLMSDDPRAESLRKKSLIHVVPIMDVDNVAIGAGGKEQSPQDHNRDWSDAPHWPSVAAAIQQITRQNDDRRFDLFIDLHNPGANSQHPFFYVPPRDSLTDIGQRNLDRFLAAAREEITGPLAFKGDVQASGAGYDKRWKAISKNWVVDNCQPHVVAVTLETAWNTPHSEPAGYQTVGRQLAAAIERYLRFATRE